ncbi:MAG TPA: NAD-dependent epimerase/dehydratase family protein, partial [Phycisphaerales bacterium]|nr:NAD-dependent epimerase/dehydratase family protein [Phycisphaerales bacterium]
ENVLRAAEIHDIPRVVHCSTVGVHGKVTHLPVNECAPFAPGDVYQRTKLEGELRAQAAIERGFPVTIARPAGIYGPGDLRFLKLFTTIQRRRFRMIGSGAVSYHFTFVDDLCRGFMVCAEHPAAVGRTYILCGQRYHPLREVVEIVAESVGAPVPRGSIPVWPVMLAARCCEGVCRPLGIEPPLYRRRLDFFVKDRAFSGARAERELGFVASVGLREGFARTARWYFEQGLLKGPMPELPNEPNGVQTLSA